MWSGLSIQARRRFPLSSPFSVPQVVPLGLRAGLRHLPGSEGPERVSEAAAAAWWVTPRESERLLDRPAFSPPPTAWLPPSYPLAQRPEDAGPVQIRV